MDREDGCVTRFDMGRLDAVERTPQGGLRVKAFVTRTGVFTYHRGDGSVVRELRHPDDVFQADSLRTLEDATLTYLHPSGRVTPDNYQSLTIGHLRDVGKNDTHVSATCIIQKKDAVDKAATKNIQEASCGYDCRMTGESGEYMGEKYDDRQTQIRYNHVALGPQGWGRGGSSVSLRLDSKDAIIDGYKTDDTGDTKTMEKVKVDGIEYEVGSGSHISALVKRADSCAERADSNAKAAETEKARADGLQGKVDSLTDALEKAQDPKAVAAAVQVRVAIEKKAAAVLGKSEKLDGLSNKEIMEKCVAKVDANFKAEGKSKDYLQGRFDMLDAKPVSAPSQIKQALHLVQEDNAEHADAGDGELPKLRPSNHYDQPFAHSKK